MRSPQSLLTTFRDAVRRRRRTAVAVLLVVSLGTGYWVWRESGPRLVMDTGIHITAASPTARFASFWTGSLCLDDTGTAEITSIEPKEAFGDVRISDYSIYPWVEGDLHPGADLKRIRDLGQFEGGTRVTEVCRKDRFTETQLALELENAGNEDALVNGVVIHYRAGKREHTVEVRLTVGLCRDGRTACDRDGR